MNNRENEEINNEKEILAIIINSINSGHKIIFVEMVEVLQCVTT